MGENIKAGPFPGGQSHPDEFGEFRNKDLLTVLGSGGASGATIWTANAGPAIVQKIAPSISRGHPKVGESDE
jgi:hypothetical protein